MQQPLSIVSQPTPENKYPDCLLMELEGVPVQPKGLVNKIIQCQSQAIAAGQIHWRLSRQFNEQWSPLSVGRIKFGLKSGELRLKLETGEFPLKARELGGLFELSVQKEIQEQSGGKNQSSVAADWVKSEPGVKANLREKKTAGTTDKLQLTSYQVTIKGLQRNSTGVFEVKTGEPVLKGLLKDALLGSLSGTAKPRGSKATFEVSVPDVQLTGVEGLRLRDIIPDKTAVLDTELALLLLRQKLQLNLSQIELQYV